MIEAVDLWEVFARLFAAYGPQGWWPVTVEEGAEPVYRPGVYLPLTPRERAEVAFGAVLAQNTSWANAKRAIVALRRAGLLSPDDILGLAESRLAEIVRSSGYFRQKARRLKTLARYLRDEGIAALETARLRSELLALSGVGPETADSILLYAFGRTAFVIDAYTRRLAVRLGLFDLEPGYEDARSVFEGALTPSVPLYNEYHALIVALSKQHCRATPACGGCPLSASCPASTSGSRG